MASAWAALSFDDDDNDDAGHKSGVASSKDAIVVLIDVREPMFKKNEEGEIFFENAVRAAYEMVKAKVINADSDLIGVIFFGAEHTKNDSDFKGVYEYLPLDNPSATAVKALEGLLDPETSDFPTQVGTSPAGPVPLYHALWACQMAFGVAKLKDHDSQRVWLFTNDDDPNKGDAAARQQAIQKAKDMAEVNQFVELFMMSPQGHEFNPDLFYADMITESDSGDALRDMSCLADVLDELRRKTYRKRVYARIPWKIADGVELSVGIYNNIYVAKKPYPVQLEARTNTPVKTETSWLCADTGAPLLPHQIRTYQLFGGERVTMDKDDMKEIKNFGEPAMTLMGFKDKSAVKPLYNFRAPWFIYPNEEDVSGSTVAFRALLHKMKELGKVAIVRMVMRAGAAPRFCALLPQDCVRDEDGFMEKTPGMHCIPLPYSDDIRALKFPPKAKASPDQIAKAKKLVAMINLKGFSSYEFPNPVLAKHFAWVQALALDEPEPDYDPAKDDVVVPNVEAMEKFKDEILEFRESFGGGDAAAGAKPARKKRAAPAKSRKAPAKKKAGGAGAGAGAGAADNIDVRALAAAGKLKSLKVPQLKAALGELGLKSSGRKADLIERIEAALK